MKEHINKLKDYQYRKAREVYGEDFMSDVYKAQYSDLKDKYTKLNGAEKLFVDEMDECMIGSHEAFQVSLINYFCLLINTFRVVQ